MENSKNNNYSGSILFLLFIFIIVGLVVYNPFNKTQKKVIESRTSNNPKIKDKEAMITIPEGEFIMGSNDAENDKLGKEFGVREGGFFKNEHPEQKFFSYKFSIDKYEVTNKEYKNYIDTMDYTPPPHWENGVYDKGKDNFPVSGVSFYDSLGYCQSVGKRLPTEAEWEYAARGPNGNIYPWGNEFNNNKGNFLKGDSVPVGSYPEDKSYFGVYDMAGNVMEWTYSWYKPYKNSKYKLDDYGEKFMVQRGGTGVAKGHFNLPKIFSRSSYRHFNGPNALALDVGFRCAVGPL